MRLVIDPIDRESVPVATAMRKDVDVNRQYQQSDA
jgi:hypothetical protein